MIDFRAFRNAFPQQVANVDGSFGNMSQLIVEEFGFHPPFELVAFWNEFSPGYYGKNELYFFGSSSSSRQDIVTWNRLQCWDNLFPSFDEGRPLFIGETSFGEQIGYRLVAGICVPVLCVLDSMTSFDLGETFKEVFENVLSERFGITDPDRFMSVVNRLGPLPKGRHFAPIVSPLLGGTGSPENFYIQDPVAHMTMCEAIYRAAQNIPDDTIIEGLRMDHS